MIREKNYIIAVDQGTTNTKAIIFDKNRINIGSAKKTSIQIFPKNGWVEQNPELIWHDTIEVIRIAIIKSKIDYSQIAAIGISNQRETTILWNKHTGDVLYNALIWQDRRTIDICKRLKSSELESNIQKKTGLLIDPYFSATKIMWLFENVPDVSKCAKKGDLAFGTVDTFLIWRLTGGLVHATDATNASRTMLFNIYTQQWDSELLEKFNIPFSILPIVKNSSDDFGYTKKKLFGIEIPIVGVAGDQQSAMIGQSCFEPGTIKSTYGTGCFIILNTGSKPILSHNRLLTTVAYRLNNKVTYALEGSIFFAGAATQWLIDKLKIIKNYSDTDKMSRVIKDTDGLYFIPAFAGLGAPYWDSEVRASISGITLNTNIEHIVRAHLEAIGYQSLDLINAIIADTTAADELNNFDILRIDGGMIENNFLCQFLADILNLKIIRHKEIEITALGIANLISLKIGWIDNLSKIANNDNDETIFFPKMSKDLRNKLYLGWQDAIKKLINNK